MSAIVATDRHDDWMIKALTINWGYRNLQANFKLRHHQFLGWVAKQPRTYAETMDAWRTSCPRISVWEDALIEGLVTTENVPLSAQGEVKVVLTKLGMDRLGELPPDPVPLVTSRESTFC